MALGIEKAIGNKLVADGFTNVFVGEEPDTPDSTITVLMDGGSPPVIGFQGETSTISETHTVTVRTRDQSYETCLDTARQVHDKMLVAQGSRDGILIARISADFPPVLLGRDRGGKQGGRWRATQSFSVLSRTITFF